MFNFLCRSSDADVVVIATPVYFTDIPGQLKSCIDRWFSFFKPGYPTLENKSRLKPGKSIVWLQTQGESVDSYRDILDRYNHSFRWLGFEQSHLIQAGGVREPGDISLYPEIIDQSRMLGEQLATNTTID